MKKGSVFFALLCAVVISDASAQSGPAVELSFSYARQSGSGSNQFAVWVEDTNGNYVKTIYAARFTAKGGFQRRPQSIPQWVKQSALAKLNNVQIDAFTGPTPKPGRLAYIWDGTNADGATVAAGDYRIFLEASLRNENRVLYSAIIPVKGASGSPIIVETEYFGTDTAVRAMISGVQVRLIYILQ